MEAGAPIFEVVVDAQGEVPFRAALDRVERQGTAVRTPQQLKPGSVCRLRIHSSDGRFFVLAEGAVVRPEPGEEQRVIVRATRFEKIAVLGGPSDSPLETPTAAATRPATGDADPEPATGDEQPAEPELPAFTVLGNYQLLKHLGGGGMAEVYLARSVLAQGVDKVVALKTVRREFGPETRYGTMFLNEARVSATLQHPNLVQVFDFGEAAGRPYLAMEHVHGRDLDAALKLLRFTDSCVSPAIVVEIGIRLCEALEYVHEKRDLDGRPLNLVHCDVSPANILVTTRGELKLMDFGVAATALKGHDKAATVMGKLSHMPPEQLQGLEPAPSWDLYPLGVTLYQLLTHNHPWQGNPRDYLLIPALRFARPPPSRSNPAVPPELDALIHRATQLDASARHPSAKALRTELEAIQKLTGRADLGAWVESMFGEKLAEEQRAIEALTAEARKKAERRVPAFLRPLVAPVRVLRLRLARRPWLLRSLIATVGLAVLVGGGGATWRIRDRGLLREQLARADAQLLAGRLTGQGSDAALDLLKAAARRWPGEPRLHRRLELLSTRFEELGSLAMDRENNEEAAAHLEAALQAVPGRASTQKKLRAVEEAVRAHSRDKVVQSQ